MDTGIYKLVCLPTGKVYVGQSQSLRLRKKSHFAGLRKGKATNRYLENAFRKYPSEDQWHFEILETCTPDLFALREDYWIRFYKSNNRRYGFNIREAAISNRGIVRSKTARKKHSKSIREYFKGSGEARLLTYNGETKFVIEWAKQFDIHIDTLLGRLRRGWPVEKALTSPTKVMTSNGEIKQRSPKEGQREKARREGRGLLTFKGETKLISEWAEEYGISKKILRGRLSGGWPLEEALSTKAGLGGRLRNLQEITFNGETKPVIKWAEQYGIPQSLLHQRLRLGWSIERALTPPDKVESLNKEAQRKRAGKLQKNFLTFNGETKLICEWAEQYGIPRTTLRVRLLRLGWPPEKALTFPIGPTRRGRSATNATYR